MDECPDHVPLDWSEANPSPVDFFLHDPYLAGIFEDIRRYLGPGIHRVGPWLIEFDETGMTAWA